MGEDDVRRVWHSAYRTAAAVLPLINTFSPFAAVSLCGVAGLAQTSPFLTVGGHSSLILHAFMSLLTVSFHLSCGRPLINTHLYILGVVLPMYFSDTVGLVPKRNDSEYRSNSLASTWVAHSTQSAATNFSTHYKHSSANQKCGWFAYCSPTPH